MDDIRSMTDEMPCGPGDIEFYPYVLKNTFGRGEREEAAARLVKAKLVVSGKREGAGRTIFLPGPYVKGDRSDLPIEESKLALYGNLYRRMPAEPAHLLFARAWKDR